MRTVTGKRMMYLKTLESELLNYRSLYPRYKKPFQLEQRLGAINFYRDSFSDESKFCEIGRLVDTAKHKDEGHVQSMQIGNWTPIANDCWLLGAFHSSKVIRLRTTNLNAIWDPSRPGTKGASYAFPVTRREITGLLEFGYRPADKQGDCITFECTNVSAAINATLTQYAKTTTLQSRNSSKVHDFVDQWLSSPLPEDDYWKN